MEIEPIEHIGKKKIITLTNIENNEKIEFIGYKKASEHLGISVTLLRKLYLDNLSCNGYKVEIKDKPKKENKKVNIETIPYYGGKISLKAIYDNGEIKQFKSCSQACDYLGICRPRLMKLSESGNLDKLGFKIQIDSPKRKRPLLKKL